MLIDSLVGFVGYGAVPGAGAGVKPPKYGKIIPPINLSLRRDQEVITLSQMSEQLSLSFYEVFVMLLNILVKFIVCTMKS